MLKKLRNFAQSHDLEIFAIATTAVCVGTVWYLTKGSNKELLLELPKETIATMKETGSAVLYATDLGDILVKVL
jgi:hypothetical protein